MKHQGRFMEPGERMKDKHLKIRIQQCLALAEAWLNLQLDAAEAARAA